MQWDDGYAQLKCTIPWHRDCTGSPNISAQLFLYKLCEGTCLAQSVKGCERHSSTDKIMGSPVCTTD